MWCQEWRGMRGRWRKNRESERGSARVKSRYERNGMEPTVSSQPTARRRNYCTVTVTVAVVRPNWLVA